MLPSARHWQIAIPVLFALAFTPAQAWPYDLGGKWTQSSLSTPITLTYSYSNLLDGSITGLTSAELSAAVVEALQLWSAAAPLQFQEQVDSGPQPSASENNYPSGSRPRLRYGQHLLDGPQSVLAHTYLPVGNLNVNGLAGDLHLDNAEAWRLTPGGGGFDIIYVLAHETGHALGLNHEDGVPSVMHTFYSGIYSGPTTAFLYPDDINGIQANYGAGFGYVMDLSGRMYLSGTSGDNVISVSRSGTNLTATSSGFGSFMRSATDVAGLEINMRSGSDTVHLNGLTTSTTDVRLLDGTVYVESGTVIHGGSSSIVQEYHWDNGAVMMQGGSLVVHGNETGGGTTGVATFQQTGGTHTIAGNLQVGAVGVGMLTLSGGGQMSSAIIYIGSQVGATGAVNVNGAGTSFSTSSDLHVGDAGTGTLSVFNAAAVNVGGELIVGPLGKIEGNGDIFANTHSTGLVSPGPTVGTLTLHGNYTQIAPASIVNAGDPQSPFGILLVELASPLSFDKLVVTGSATLGGTLQVSLLSGFTPTAGSAFDILDWGWQQGTFTTLLLPALQGSLAWNTMQLYTAGLLSVVDTSLLPGDFNRDGHVNAADIAAMLAALSDLNAFKTSHNFSDADLLAIGDVDQSGTTTNADLQSLLNLLKSGGGSVTSVPEPTSWVTIACALASTGLCAAALGTRRTVYNAIIDDRIMLSHAIAVSDASKQNSLSRYIVVTNWRERWRGRHWWNWRFSSLWSPNGSSTTRPSRSRITNGFTIPMPTRAGESRRRMS